MYGSRREYEGRITGFTMGTGQTLSLLPPQNATGNFVKIVQRLPVRIELTHYDPDKVPLFHMSETFHLVGSNASPSNSSLKVSCQPAFAAVAVNSTASNPLHRLITRGFARYATISSLPKLVTQDATSERRQPAPSCGPEHPCRFSQ
jgi:hypothetical protein